MAELKLEEAQAFLQKETNGTSVFDHLSDVLMKVLTERPDNAVELFEQLSTVVKSERSGSSSSGSEEALDSASIARFARAIADLHLPAVGEEEDDEPVLKPTRTEVVEDLLAKSVQWECAGVNPLGSREDVVRVCLSLNQLAGADESIESLSLWGKFLCKSGEYIVAQGTKSDDSADGDEDENDLPEGEANKYTYWVCSFPGAGAWVELPRVTPKQILCTQQIRRFFTGDLDAPVSGFPVFPGTEKNLVRSTIALINSECAIAPSGYYVVEEEATEATVSEEYAPGDVTDAGEWQTFGLAFNELGRVTAVESEDEEGNPVTTPEDWTLEPLRAVNPDNWVVRNYNKSMGGSKFEPVVLRSKVWPGAFASANVSNGDWANIYVGYGARHLAEPFTPPMPPQLQTEFDESELVEQDDVLEDPSPPEDEDDE